MGSVASYKRMKEHYQYLTVRIPHDEMGKLREYAKQRNTSLNQAILSFITWSLEQEEDND